MKKSLRGLTIIAILSGVLFSLAGCSNAPGKEIFKKPYGTLFQHSALFYSGQTNDFFNDLLPEYRVNIDMNLELEKSNRHDYLIKSPLDTSGSSSAAFLLNEETPLAQGDLDKINARRETLAQQIGAPYTPASEGYTISYHMTLTSNGSNKETDQIRTVLKLGTRWYWDPTFLNTFT